MQDNQKQTLWAYVAGIMDADGCFLIIRHRRKTKNRESERAKRFPKSVRMWSWDYQPSVKIAMTELEAIELIHGELNSGKYHLEGTRPKRPNSKPIYQWYERRKDRTAAFLEKVIPYLRVKRKRAEFLLEFSYHLMNCKNPGYRGVSMEELDYREESYIKMREFNGNKVAATTKSLGRESASDSLDS